MPLASSGYISLGGTDPTRSANLAAGQAATATITMPSSVTRTLTGVSSGPIVLPNNYWGKPAGFTTVSLASLPSDWFAYNDGEFIIELNLIFFPDGQWFYTEIGGGGTLSGNWGSPTSAGAGAAYWVKFTRTGITPVGGGEYSTPTTGWLNLASNQSVQVFTYASNPTASSATYTIEIATDSAGANVIATRTSVRLVAVPSPPP